MTIKGSTLNSYQLLNTNSSLVHNRCLSVIGIDNYKHSCNFTDFSSSYFFVRNAAVTLSARAAREAQGLLAPWPWRSSRPRLTRCPWRSKRRFPKRVTTTPHAVPMEVKAPLTEKGHDHASRGAREAQGLLAPWPWRSSRPRLTRCPWRSKRRFPKRVTATLHAVPIEVKAPVPEKGHGAVTLSARAAREAQGLLAVPGVVGADGIMRPIHAILQNARGEIKNLVLPTYKKG